MTLAKIFYDFWRAVFGNGIEVDFMGGDAPDKAVTGGSVNHKIHKSIRISTKTLADSPGSIPKIPKEVVCVVVIVVKGVTCAIRQKDVQETTGHIPVFIGLYAYIRKIKQRVLENPQVYDKRYVLLF